MQPQDHADFGDLSEENLELFRQQLHATYIVHEDAVSPVPGESTQDRFSYVCVLGKPWGGERTQMMRNGMLARESVPCTLFMYRGNYSDRQFAAILPPLAHGSAVVLPGGGPGCVAWAGMTHELMVMDLPLGIGFGCWNCKDTTITN